MSYSAAKLCKISEREGEKRKKLCQKGRQRLFFRVGLSEVQCKLLFWQQAEGHSMVRCGAELSNGFTMCFGGIAEVAVPTILRVFLGECFHAVVTIGLGQHGGCRDGKVSGIALDDGVGGNLFVRAPAVAIDNDVLWPYSELIQCPLHGQDGAAQDI